MPHETHVDAKTMGSIEGTPSVEIQGVRWRLGMDVDRRVASQPCSVSFSCQARWLVRPLSSWLK